MRYITDDNGYLLEVSFGADIECDGKICTEYTGDVPAGYDSLADWFTLESDKLHRWHIVEGQLTLDEQAPDPEVYVPPEPEPKTGMRRLWRNDDQNVFSGQTVPLDWSGYELLQIICAHDSVVVKAELGQVTQVKMVFVNDNATVCAGYRWVEVTADGVFFSDEVTTTIFGMMTQNDRLTPLEIYGINGVITTTEPAESAAICGTFLCGEAICGQ